MQQIIYYDSQQHNFRTKELQLFISSSSIYVLTLQTQLADPIIQELQVRNQCVTGGVGDGVGGLVSVLFNS